ncbi:translesion DNA synthesis-associated protein ImuA [Vibrio astriarenae]|uniref:translesion DNA synthesis-associated protein ImuA n=1 Tax=Vibrio astriarenae TaxID=1481923 RepID=UPI0037357ED8
MHELISHLKDKQWLWQGSQQPSHIDRTSTGFDHLDQQLGGGYPNNGVIELTTALGIGELRLLQPHLAAACGERLIALIGLPDELCLESFTSMGINFSQLLLVNSQESKSQLWAAEQCLKSGACSHVLLWQEDIEVHQARRLQVAAEQGSAIQFLFTQRHQRTFSLPVSLSMNLHAQPYGLNVTITKQKGGWPTEPFFVDMRQYWPQLVPKHLLSQGTPSTVVPFPMQLQG